MAIKFDFVSHHPYFGILLWNEDDKCYNLWHPFAYADLDEAKIESFVRNGVVVHWSWPSSVETALLGPSVDSDLPF